MTINRDYGIAIIVKQCQVDTDEATKRFDSLPSDQQSELIEAGANARLHVVRRLLGLATPEIPTKNPVLQITPGETIEIPRGLYLLHPVQQVSQGGESPTSLVSLELIGAPHTDESDGVEFSELSPRVKRALDNVLPNESGEFENQESGPSDRKQQIETSTDGENFTE
ncbi:hypothetical protein KOR42_39410 [Thalassoglobus neptunius]|uniref:Uncharacterized protein n=1 Tax=Thalassoglobus neptunius TaxID=1938619 RepID=A0A5C5WFZ8_9PLAN|nr:hypothetical protein [Thalassoglobus neptunius]TWT49025.1 hypothetical protein KOR42_39410 [Thalassoglobus neptunius]